MAALRIPDEFCYLVDCFYQGTRDEYENEEEWIRTRLEFLNKEQKVVVKKFLRELLSRNYSVEQLRDAWESGNSCYWIEGKSLRPFFTMILETIG